MTPIREEKRRPSPAITPQALAWHRDQLWVGSRDLRRVYAMDVDDWSVAQEIASPGIPWAAVSTGEELQFTLGEGDDDDRYVRRFDPESGFGAERVACPECTGSYLSFDGADLYLSQWYKHRILQLDATGKIVRAIDVGEEICGHTFADGMIYLLRGTEQGSESWRIARLDPALAEPGIEDLATVPFACRSLTFDGALFWTNHRAAGEIVSFSVPR